MKYHPVLEMQLGCSHPSKFSPWNWSSDCHSYSFWVHFSSALTLWKVSPLVSSLLLKESFNWLAQLYILFLFPSDSTWAKGHVREHPPVINCGFSYLLFTFVVAVIGLILFLVVVKRYKYRERDDRPYDQSMVYRRAIYVTSWDN